MLDRLLIVPALHGRLESAKRARRALEAFRPDVVAVEIPETLQSAFTRAVARLPLLSVLRWQVTPTGEAPQPALLLVEPADPAVEAARFALERGLPVVCCDRDSDDYGARDDLVPDSYALDRLGDDRFDELVRAGLGPSDEEDARREATMAFHVRRLLDEGKRVALVCGAAHERPIRDLLPAATVRPLGRTKRDVELFHLHEDASREVLVEPPFLQAAWERHRAAAPREDPRIPDDAPAAEVVSLRPAAPVGEPAAPVESDPEPPPDRWELLARLARAAARRHEAEDGGRVARNALSILLRMSRNWALLSGRLGFELVQIVTCARGVGGDDYAYRFWELATHWPWQSARPGLPVLRPSVEDLYERAAHLRFRRSVKSRRHTLRVVSPRPREKRPGEWKENWRGESIVSYPPEDLVIEGYGAFLKKRAVGILSAEQSRTEPFSTSLRDGIDLRETIRNLVHDGRIYVRENRPVKGNVGAVVIIFDEDFRDERYPWMMTWQGEHDEESDMALYATPPGTKLVGPGVSRCEYGGLLMTLPPGRMFSVWEDPYFEPARDKPERLLMAGLDYSLERLVVYVAAKPPRSSLATYANRRGKKIVYVPIGQLSPIMLKKVRGFHVLDGRRVRAWAKDYIR